MDFIYGRMDDDIEQTPEDRPTSEIQEFFSGKTIFLTGCTGFIGKCLVEKLLRTCSDIKRLYILVRMKQNENIEQRVEDYFNHIVFRRLRKLRPNFQDQVRTIAGDLSLPGIDISSEDRRLLTETVDVIIHNAAIVIFSAKISNILRINVLGTKEMLDLATECRHLICFLYISTAYSHCYLKTIEEKFYTPPANLQMVYDMIKADTENEAGLSKEYLENLLHPYPNSYIFTKAVAEGIVQEYAKKVSFPCGIFRMSIVISTYKEPIRSWCGNKNGPTFMILTVALGILHTMYCSKEGTPDMIPADMTANACLVAVWDLVKNKKDCKEGCIYNYGSSTTNTVTYSEIQKRSMKQCRENPPSKSMGISFFITAHNYFTFLIGHILFHYIPAIIVDISRLAQLKKPKFIPMLIKIERHMKIIVYFTSQNWCIKMGEMLRVWDEMNPVDHELFFCDLRKLDWADYISRYWYGLRVYLLNDPMENVEIARQRQQIIMSSTYFFFGLIMLLIFYVVFHRINSYFV